MEIFNPQRVSVISDKTYEGTRIPKLTDEQVSYARNAFADFLRNLAAHGMKFDYEHMYGGFYVRDYRLGWNCNSTAPADETVRESVAVWSDIITDGNIDISANGVCAELPLFTQESDGFKLLDTTAETLPY